MKISDDEFYKLWELAKKKYNKKIAHIGNNAKPMGRDAAVEAMKEMELWYDEELLRRLCAALAHPQMNFDFDSPSATR